MEETVAHSDPVPLEPLFLAFINANNPSTEDLQRLAKPLFAREGLPQLVQESAPEDQDKFVNAADRVCRFSLLHEAFLKLFFPGKAFPIPNPENIRYLTTLGDICALINRIPAFVAITAGLRILKVIPDTSGGLMGVWHGEYGPMRVAVKVFRTYPDGPMHDATKVRDVCLYTKGVFPNSVGRFYSEA